MIRIIQAIAAGTLAMAMFIVAIGLILWSIFLIEAHFGRGSSIIAMIICAIAGLWIATCVEAYKLFTGDGDMEERHD